MAILALRAALCGISLVTVALAQQVHVVSPTGGNFTEIQSAIHAAQPGDVILVRAGTYSSFAVDRGVRVLADPGVGLTGFRITSIGVANVPAGQTAVVRGFGFGVMGLTLSVTDNLGHVHIERVTTGGLFGGAIVARSANVTLHHCAFTSLGITIQNSTVAMTRCTAEGTPLANPVRGGLNLTLSRVWFAEGVANGGPASPLPAVAAPGVVADRSDLFVAGDGATVIAAGASLNSTPVAAVHTTNSTVVIDPTVTVNGHFGGPERSGTGQYTRAAVPSQLATLAAPSQIDMRLHAPGALRGYMLLSLVPARSTPLGAIGDFWLDAPHFVVDGGAFPANGVRTAQLQLPPLFPGQPVVVQGLVVYPSGVQLSAPAPLLIRY